MAHVAALKDHRGLAARPGALARVLRSVANYRQFRTTYRELDALTDRELADLGLSRLSIGDIARQSVYGD